MPVEKPFKPPLFKSLSARLLVLTIGFVMLSEVLIYAPSVARFRKVYLEERIATAHLATLAMQSVPGQIFHPRVGDELLNTAESYNIVLRKEGRSLLILGGDVPPVEETFDLRRQFFLVWVKDAFLTLVGGGNRVLRIVGNPPKDPTAIIEVVIDEAPLREAMIDFSKRVLGLSIIISLITAALVFLALQRMMVGPIRRITESMSAFRANPEDEATTIKPSRRGDEMGLAQRELAVMQDELRASLVQKTRLAALGAAVAKINHDLRNTLATAMLVSDRLADSADPDVRHLAPRLYDAIDRAVQLCGQTLKFAREAVPKMQAICFPIYDLVEEARLGATTGKFAADRSVTWINEIGPDLLIDADREQLYRVLVNIGRNAYQAGATEVRVTVRLRLHRVLIDLTDNGPGLPEQAKEHLFEPFSGSAREGGTGLGLVIARDVMRAHRGDISLVRTGPEGTVFCLDLPEVAETGPPPSQNEGA